MEPRYNKGLRDWKNMFTITRLRNTGALFKIYILLILRQRSFAIPRTSSVEVRKSEVHVSYNFIFFIRFYCNVCLAKQGSIVEETLFPKWIPWHATGKILASEQDAMFKKIVHDKRTREPVFSKAQSIVLQSWKTMFSKTQYNWMFSMMFSE